MCVIFNPAGSPVVRLISGITLAEIFKVLALSGGADVLFVLLYCV